MLSTAEGVTTTGRPETSLKLLIPTSLKRPQGDEPIVMGGLLPPPPLPPLLRQKLKCVHLAGTSEVVRELFYTDEETVNTLI